jgi:hypothetical protein
MSRSSFTHDDSDIVENGQFTEEDIRVMLKIMRGKGKLPDEYRIPSKAWSLLSPEAREAFINTRDTALEKIGLNSHEEPRGTESKETSQTTLAKQYHGGQPEQ